MQVITGYALADGRRDIYPHTLRKIQEIAMFRFLADKSGYAAEFTAFYRPDAMWRAGDKVVFLVWLGEDAKPLRFSKLNDPITIDQEHPEAQSLHINGVITGNDYFI